MTYTNQEIFDKVVEHLFIQGRPAVSHINGSCRYRWSGLSCAVGCLIPDHSYSESFEGLPVADILPKLSNIFDGESVYLLRRLQIVHDDNSLYSTKGLTSSGVSVLKLISYDFSLDLPERLL